MKETVKNIFSILHLGEQSRLVKLILLDVLVSILDIAFLVLLIYVIHFYTGDNRSLLLSHFPFLLFNKYPLLLISAFLILFAAKNGLGYLVFSMQYRFVYAVASRLAKNNLLHFLRGSFAGHVHIDSSVFVRKISQQPIQFGHHILGGFQQITGQSILVILSIIAILIYNPLLFPLLLIILTPPVILAGLFVKRKLTSIRKTAKPVSEKTHQHLQEALSGYIESNIYQRDDFFINRYSVHQEKFNDFLSQQIVLQNIPSRLIEVFAIFGLLLLIVLNQYMGNSGGIKIITIGAFMAAAYKIIPGIVKILNSAGQMKTYGFTVTDLLPNREPALEKSEGQHTEIISLKMENIAFTYKEEILLNNFSLEMNKGDLTGLTGMSGKGKTTVLNLLLGFLEPQSGNIHINDRITTAAGRKEYWNNIAYVKQQSFLIHDTIRTNITLAEPGALANVFDERRLEEAVKASGLDILANQYPEGLNKIITENGKNISGGQRQRIAIARAFYKNADLIILDEPFNELDKASENKLLEYCATMALAGKMIILITHSKQSLSFCSKIISLDET